MSTVDPNKLLPTNASVCTLLPLFFSGALYLTRHTLATCARVSDVSCLGCMRGGLFACALAGRGGERRAPLPRIRSISTVPDWLSTQLLEAFDVNRVVIANLDPSKGAGQIGGKHGQNKDIVSMTLPTVCRLRSADAHSNYWCENNGHGVGEKVYVGCLPESVHVVTWGLSKSEALSGIFFKQRHNQKAAQVGNWVQKGAILFRGPYISHCGDFKHHLLGP